ncbi:hypothetical protein PMAYCL1PPCAC_01525, partial [Pristionchus mayeri]
KEEPMEFNDELIEEFDKVKHEDPGLSVRTIGATTDITEEPFEIKDEPLDDCMQEGPIADMYCPSKRTSRPHDQSIPSINCENPSKAKVSLHKCVVCHRLCSQSEMHFFTSNPKKREMWVDGVRQTPEGR